MKKILLTLAGAMSIAAGANAQLADGTIFPDFTRYDINGNSHHLYADLDAGKTVFIDISATWCAPCWAYHTSGKLDSIWAKHGPLGEPGVDATSTNDVVVYFVQGEPGSGLAELTYNTWGTGAQNTTFNHTNFTQGNWVAGSNYYIIDDSTGQAAYNTSWNIAFFPTVYMICRDHIVHQLTQPDEPTAYAAAQATCPSYAPSTTVDAKVTPYQGNSYFVCNGTPSVKFQNYGTNNITSATITIKDATGATAATVPWTGSLAPYEVATVPVPAFAGTTFGGYKYSVSATGDTNPTNDASVDSVFKIYTSGNAASLPATENFEGTSISYKETFNTPDGYLAVGRYYGQVNAAGDSGSSLIFLNWYSQSGTVQEYVFGNFNTASATSDLTLSFDKAYAQYDATSNDALDVKISTDCGATWTSIYSKAGANLTSVSSFSTTAFKPTTGAMWNHVWLPLTSAANANLMIKFIGTSTYGNNLFVDNIKLAVTTAVTNVSADNEIVIAPNPATDRANILMTLNDNANVQVQVIDALGRVMSSSNQDLKAGAQKIEVSTSAFPAGVYNVKMVVDGVVTVKQLSVIK